MSDNKDDRSVLAIGVGVALATGMILLIPLIAMAFTEEVQWSLMDFVVMGLMLYLTCSLFVLVARKMAPGKRYIAAILFAGGFLLLWAELAVGIFTDWGS